MFLANHFLIDGFVERMVNDMLSDNTYKFKRMPGVALYQQIKDMLRAEIAEMSSGEQIPSEQTLMEMYGVSRGPIRQAITELVYEGVLFRIQGKGTFRAGATVNCSQFEVSSLTDQLLRSGMEPGIQNVQLDSVIPPPTVSRYLRLDGMTEVWRLSRVRTANNVPITFSQGYIPKHVVPSLHVEDLEMSIVSMLRGKFQVEMPISHSLCAAKKADDILVERLGVQPGDAMLHIEFVASNSGGEPVLVDITDANGERYVMHIEQS